MILLMLKTSFRTTNLSTDPLPRARSSGGCSQGDLQFYAKGAFAAPFLTHLPAPTYAQPAVDALKRLLVSAAIAVASAVDYPVRQFSNGTTRYPDFIRSHRTSNPTASRCLTMFLYRVDVLRKTSSCMLVYLLLPHSFYSSLLDDILSMDAVSNSL